MCVYGCASRRRRRGGVRRARWCRSRRPRRPGRRRGGPASRFAGSRSRLRISSPYRTDVIPDQVGEPATYAPIRRAVLEWFRANGRPLAFRATSDPWAILVSEFMAQQTQAARAAEAWERYLVEFPTPAALAEASPADALRAWRGLGYNRRALSLRAAAREIVARHGGQVPSDLQALDALPGVGPYTARALAALAFGQRLGAVDTNARRLLGRALFAEAPSVAELQATADATVPADRPGAATHALMRVAATSCRP